MQKFYDNIDIIELCTQASDTEYQPVLLALGMLMHMALRGIKAYNTHPGLVMPQHGIIAGCTQSTYLQL